MLCVAEPTAPVQIEEVAAGRRSGLLRLAPAGEEAAWATWTGTDGIRLARIERGRAPAPASTESPPPVPR